ncbi:M48 family metalloprotease [Chryseobacterium mucoviscidosis]|uniref:M48 family metalloprotease n=1 Tax=Chryseobacterium mucoviscidosis TaxID=1945581 RepID=UPI0031CEAA1F
MTKNIHSDFLKKFYFKKARNHKFRVNLRIIILVALPTANILLTFFSESKMFYDEFEIFNLFFSLLMSVIILLYILYYYTRTIKNLLPKSTYTEINNETHKGIWEMCHKTMDQINLRKLRLKIYYMKTNTVDAHITLENNTVHLFLSRGIISHSYHSSKDVESILGHEFGHICQGDSKLFLITKRAFGLPIFLNNLQLILNLALTVLVIFFAPGGLGACIAQLILLLIYRRLYTGFSRLRKESEFLADSCSLIFIENSQIAKIVENYLPDIDSPNYPSRKERLKNIESFSII